MAALDLTLNYVDRGDVDVGGSDTLFFPVASLVVPPLSNASSPKYTLWSTDNKHTNTHKTVICNPVRNSSHQRIVATIKASEEVVNGESATGGGDYDWILNLIPRSINWGQCVNGH